jgi:hypothetical protein
VAVLPLLSVTAHVTVVVPMLNTTPSNEVSPSPAVAPLNSQTILAIPSLSLATTSHSVPSWL